MVRTMKENEICQLYIVLLIDERLERFQETEESDKKISKYLEEVKQEKGINAMLDVDELLIENASNHESQGFINGFRYAMKLKEDCVV